ncbi:Tubulin binding cofactor C-like domain [Trypanosoma melophagium]|uniref:Tubulin binding cofactor C-like domain n=1 Tax=Trypanosoma melophagium TaxID=715481 RepID=UPI003519EFBD|nr:Tubulin binding cofactor C-like domain [Trypanosoma melophagium]
MDFDDSTDSDERMATAAHEEEVREEDLTPSKSESSSPAATPQRVQETNKKNSSFSFSVPAPAAAVVLDNHNNEEEYGDNDNDVIPAAGGVQRLVIKSTPEEVANDVQFSSLPHTNVRGRCGEYLHHQLVDAEDVLRRPLARHGLVTSRSTGRLGCAEEDVKEEEYKEEEDEEYDEMDEGGEYENDFEDQEYEEGEDDEEKEDKYVVEEEVGDEDDYDDDDYNYKEDYEKDYKDIVPDAITTMQDEKSTVFLEYSKEWDKVLNSMEIADTTLMTHFYIGYGCCWTTNPGNTEESAYETESMVKVISPFYRNPIRESDEALPTDYNENAKKEEKEEKEEDIGPQEMTLNTLKCLASHILSMQSALAEEGMTRSSSLQRKELQVHEYAEEEEGSDVNSCNVICRGFHSVHVDSSCRLVGVVDVDSCSVSLSDVIAFTDRPFTQEEIVALLKSIIGKVSALHNAGFVHGCLHGGNILCCADDGHTVLTGVSGIMSNPLFPADPSFISPRLAAAMQPLVDHVWSYEKKMGNSETFPWASDPEFHRGLLELYGCGDETEMRPRSSDDVYAIGIITLSCLFGVPPFHLATLKEVIDLLVPYYHDCKSCTNSNGSKSSGDTSLLGTVFTSSYAMWWFKLAGYTEEFIDIALDFVEFCLLAGVGETIGLVEMAGDLLKHPIFVKYPIVGKMDGNSEIDSYSAGDVDCIDETVCINGIIHCLVYPIFGVLAHAKKNCGTTSPMKRPYRNSIFSARWEALQFGVKCDADNNELFFRDAVGVLWPYLDRQIPRWCNGNKGFYNPIESTWSSLLYGASLKRSFYLSKEKEKGDAVSVLMTLAEEKDMQFNHENRTFMYNEKCNRRLVINREELHSEYRTLIDTLILCDLEDCVVEIFAGFRFIVLRNIRRCEIYLGPCFFCYCDEVSDCNPIAVASAHLLIHGVSHIKFWYTGLTAPRCQDAQRLPRDICITPYSIAYAGISADFAALGVPQVHASNKLKLFEEVNSTTINSIERTLKLPNTLRGGFDYPYSHALAAYGTRLVHEHDSVSDVFLFPSEMTGKNIRITHIHGDEYPTLDMTSGFSSNITRLPSWKKYNYKSEKEEKEIARYPMVCVLDVVGDCVISDCSCCTIILLGSCELLTLRRCDSVHFIFAARAVEMRDCVDVLVEVNVRENVLLEYCHSVRLSALTFSGPLHRAWRYALQNADITERFHYTDTIDTENEEDNDNNIDNDIDNVILREEVELCECDDVQLEESTTILSIGGGTGKTALKRKWKLASLMQHVWGYQQEEKEKEDSSLSLITRRGKEEEEEYKEHDNDNKHKGKDGVWAWATSSSPVRLHDMFNVSILRFPETLNVRQTAITTTRTTGEKEEKEKDTLNNLPLIDVVLERLVVGLVHLSEAVGTLFICKCSGPLDIIVCAARCVIMESCEHVTLQTACVNFTAIDCRACHVALHVNTPPRYIDCTDMQTSTLNITSENYENFLNRTDVSIDENRFDEPELLLSRVSSLSTEKETQKISSTSTSDAYTQITLPEIKSINSYSAVSAVLQRPITIVPPLHATCVGLKDAPFFGPLEDRVNNEMTIRKPFETDIMSALLFLSDQDKKEKEEMLGKTVLPDKSALTSETKEEKNVLRDNIHQEITNAITSETVKERHVDPFPVDGEAETKESPMFTIVEATASSTSINNNNNNNNNNGNDGMTLDSARFPTSQKTPRSVVSQHLSSNCSNNSRNRRNRRGDGFSRAIDDDDDEDDNNDYNNSIVNEEDDVYGGIGNYTETQNVKETISQEGEYVSSGAPLRSEGNLTTTTTVIAAETEEEEEEEEEIDEEENENNNNNNKEDAEEMDKEEDVVETVKYFPILAEERLKDDPVNNNNNNNNNNNDEQKKDNTELESVAESEMSDFMSIEDYPPSDFIIAAHPKDEEMIQSVMQQVAATREMFFSARRTLNNFSSSCKNSTVELQKRVENALVKLQSLLK